ncbi:hypothetical protein MHH42_30890 [Bacillus sp. FSL L8-0099]|uniref:hypothetical protein n=1 Tax=unclassified Bacillus (in: firmicutes) TaxID=185979 RepID=UPI0030F548DD
MMSDDDVLMLLGCLNPWHDWSGDTLVWYVMVSCIQVGCIGDTCCLVIVGINIVVYTVFMQWWLLLVVWLVSWWMIRWYYCVHGGSIAGNI